MSGFGLEPLLHGARKGIELDLFFHLDNAATGIDVDVLAVPINGHLRLVEGLAVLYFCESPLIVAPLLTTATVFSTAGGQFDSLDFLLLVLSSGESG